MFWRRRAEKATSWLPFADRRARVSNDVRDMSSGGWYEAQLLDRRERGARAHDSDQMVERERWDLLG